jgi:hypothetical protein
MHHAEVADLLCRSLERDCDRFCRVSSNDLPDCIDEVCMHTESPSLSIQKDERSPSTCSEIGNMRRGSLSSIISDTSSAINFECDLEQDGYGVDCDDIDSDDSSIASEETVSSHDMSGIADFLRTSSSHLNGHLVLQATSWSEPESAEIKSGLESESPAILRENMVEESTSQSGPGARVSVDEATSNELPSMCGYFQLRRIVRPRIKLHSKDNLDVSDGDMEASSNGTKARLLSCTRASQVDDGDERLTSKISSDHSDIQRRVRNSMHEHYAIFGKLGGKLVKLQGQSSGLTPRR